LKDVAGAEHLQAACDGLGLLLGEAVDDARLAWGREGCAQACVRA
jgi:hypothetical protein